jgi:hypothetical protein
VEFASEISGKLRILKREGEVCPDNAVSSVKCICRFHNIVIDTENCPRNFREKPAFH